VKSIRVLIYLYFLFFIGSQTLVYGQQNKELEIKNAIVKASTTSQKIELQVELGKYYLTTNLSKAKDLLDYFKKTSAYKSKNVYVRLTLFEIQYAHAIKDNETFNRLIEQNKDFSKSQITEKEKIEWLNYTGIAKQLKLDYLSALTIHSQALKRNQRLRNHELSAELNRMIAWDYANLNKKDSALYFSNRSIVFARKTNSKSSILAECINTQALIYKYFNQVEIGIAKNMLAIEIIENTTDYEKLSRYNREIGLSQLDIKNWEEAESYFKKSLSFANQLQDQSQIGLALIYLAAVELGKKNLTTAKGIAYQAESALSKSLDLEAIGDVDNFIGILYSELKDYKQAAVRLNKALVNYESIGNRNKIATVYHYVGKVLLEQGKFLEAESFLNRSINMRKEMKQISSIHESYKVLSDLFLRKGNIQSAFQYLNFYVQYLDSNNLLQSARSIAEINETFKTQEQLRTINLQSDSIRSAKEKQELTNSKLENTQLRNTYQLITIVFILFIVLAAGLILKNYWNRNKLLQLQKESEMSQTLLRSQMNPHFIFNAMSVIQSYIYDNDPSKSSKFLVNFSRLMRLILENSSKEFITIETEIEILQKYLTTQKLRFEDRFAFEIKLDPNLSESETLIPPMITQPFIENSIEHGQLHTIENGFIEVTFSVDSGMLHIEIIDNGIGRKNAAKNKKSEEHHSMAMKITEERIAILNKKYISSGFIHISDFDKENESGTIVDIKIPLKFKDQNS